MYKLIITSGCSFSSVEGGDTWVCDLERYYRAVNPSCEFQHLAVASQGNELVQKKATRAVLSAVSRYRPEEVALFVMWSTHDRRAFYLPEHTRDLVRIPVFDNNPIPPQFTDLSGVVQSGSGWVHVHGSTRGQNPVADFYYSHMHSLELGVHVTLENMLIVALLVRQTGIACCSMMIMTQIYHSILEQRASNLSGHLYSAMDWSSVDLVGELDYLRSQPDPDQYFMGDGWHPNRQGHSLWFQQRLLPRISGSAG
jgi:hypothetical protein